MSNAQKHEGGRLPGRTANQAQLHPDHASAEVLRIPALQPTIYCPSDGVQSCLAHLP